MKMIQIFLFLFSLSMSINSYSQQMQNISSAFSNNNTSIGSVSWTLGDLLTSSKEGFLSVNNNVWILSSIEKPNFYSTKNNVYIDKNLVDKEIQLTVDKESLPAKVRLINTNGIVIVNYDINSIQSNIKLPTIPQSMYFLNIEYKGGTYTFKIIKK